MLSLFEIEIFQRLPYPEGNLATVKQATEERDRGVEPALAAVVPDLTRYGTVYLGFPIWGETAPSLIRGCFLRAHDLSSKALVPFITHGGYGWGKVRPSSPAMHPRRDCGLPFECGGCGSVRP